MKYLLPLLLLVFCVGAVKPHKGAHSVKEKKVRVLPMPPMPVRQPVVTKGALDAMKRATFTRTLKPYPPWQPKAMRILWDGCVTGRLEGNQWKTDDGDPVEFVVEAKGYGAGSWEQIGVVSVTPFEFWFITEWPARMFRVGARLK